VSHGSIFSGACYWCSACRRGFKTQSHVLKHVGAVREPAVDAKGARRRRRQADARFIEVVSDSVKARLGLV